MHIFQEIAFMIAVLENKYILLLKSVLHAMSRIVINVYNRIHVITVKIKNGSALTKLVAFIHAKSVTKKIVISAKITMENAKFVIKAMQCQQLLVNVKKQLCNIVNSCYFIYVDSVKKDINYQKISLVAKLIVN